MCYSNESYLRNKEQLRINRRKWAKKNPDKIKAFNFKQKLKINYGLSLDAYSKLLNNQNNRCAICEKETKLVVDHCHDSKTVRGMLCFSCNLGLGHFKDDKQLLIKAIDYLDKENKTSF